MIFFGLIFIFSGLASMAGMIYGGIVANQFFMLPFGMVFGGAFIAAGYFAAIQPVLHQKRLLRKAKKTGRIFGGIIIAYDDDTSVRINGMPLLVIIVRVAVDGSYRDIAYNTKQVNEKPYPLGASCAVYVCDGEAVVDPDSVEVTLDSKGRYERYMEEEEARASKNNESILAQMYNPKMNPKLMQGMPYAGNPDGQLNDPYAQHFDQAPTSYLPNSFVSQYDQSSYQDSYSDSPNSGEHARYLNGKPVDKYGNPL